MLKFVKGLFDVARHAEVDVAVFIVPFKGDTAVEGSGPVTGEDVLEPNDIEKVVNVFFPNVLDTEAVHYNAEGGGRE